VVEGICRETDDDNVKTAWPDDGKVPVEYGGGTLGDELPVVFRDVTNAFGRDGVPAKLNWYSSSVSLNTSD
jgi:hypothetical protein